MFSLYLRERIVRLSQQRHKATHIVTILFQEGFEVSVRAVYYVLKRYKQTGSFFDRPRSGRPRIISEAVRTRIEDWLKDNDELTTTELMQKLRDLDHRASRATVGRLRQSLGWTAKATRYCQLIRDANKVKRVEFCQRVLQSGENFNDIVFTDESMVQLSPSKRKLYHKKGQPCKFRPKAKHPVKVYIWGGISKRGATNCVLFTATMDGPLYTKILEQGLLPFTSVKFPDGKFSARQ